MPLLHKRVISNFLRSDCLRRLRLDLVPDTQAYTAERQNLNMPPRDVGRPGLRALTDAGDLWEKAKVNDLAEAIGINNLIGTYQTDYNGKHSFSRTALAQVINQASPGRFLVEAEYPVGPAFLQATGLTSVVAQHNLNFWSFRPDLIQVMPPSSITTEILTDGTVVPVASNDVRTPLRVIDIKLTAEPSVPYFIEVTLYSIILAAWLTDQKLTDRYFVSPHASVWPGSHDASEIMKYLNDCRSQGRAPTNSALLNALENDLEECPVQVMVPRLRRFFSTTLPMVLSTNWQSLDWHVDNRCSGCDYLGYPWGNTQPHPDHCWSMANTQGHLSRVAFISRGARGALVDNNISTVKSLANTPANSSAYDAHHTLRATRTVVSSRAQALTTQTAGAASNAGSSAVMPAWADLRIYLSADFDIGSGITMAFGLSGTWAVGQNQVPPGQPHYHRWQAQVFPVDQRDLATEERELLNFLGAIDTIMNNVSGRTAIDLRGNPRQPTMQVYIWDKIIYEHLVRVIGRHLPAIIRHRALKRLAWIFPPDSLVANPEISDRDCPITIVREVIKAIVAAPVPHYYSLLNIARSYHSSQTQAPYNQFQVLDLFEDPLSDQIPSERAHEIWSRTGGTTRPWHRQLQFLESTVKTKLSALESVAQRLGEDLRGNLNQTAPRITDLRPPALLQRAADDARLWFVFAKLNVALDELEIQKIHAMPPHEREAKFKSAILPNRLTGQAAQRVLNNLGLQPAANRFVYELSPNSREVRAREGDFTFALSPQNRPGFLSQRISSIAQGTPINLPSWGHLSMPIRLVTNVTVKSIDRDNGHIVLDLNQAWLSTFNTLEQTGRMNLAGDVILDPVHRDFLIRRLEATLNAIGNPPIAIANSHPGVAQALGRTRAPSRGTPSPSSEVLWNPQLLQQSQTLRILPPVRNLLTTNNLTLNPSQWNAWEESLSHRLRLIWGPPGTGKSRTLIAIILGALIEATQQGKPLRVLLTGPTYEAIDNVLLPVVDQLATFAGLVLAQNTMVARLRSPSRLQSSGTPQSIDVPNNQNDPAIIRLRLQLRSGQGLALVGATTQQVHKFLEGSGGATQEFFDLILVDEASQMDVAQSTLALAGLASEGSVIIAGDPMQLPPIHRAERPVGLEDMVGPIFSYFENRFSITPLVLETNYRSCREIVELGYEAGYPRSLHANSNDLTIDIQTPIPPSNQAPQNWPQHLYWTPEWTALLNPTQKVVCYVYPEGRSSQWNPFEADAIASLAWLLYGRLGDQLFNEYDPTTSQFRQTTNTPYNPSEFWHKGIGIVTPHRAQQALTVSRLQSIFHNTNAEEIRNAVDTVERFQGQQRDIILATFALGDPDAIGTEDEFLMSLNRFNVMASRARAKLIVFVSQNIVDHLSSDLDVLKDSALIKNFAEVFCNQYRKMTLGYINKSTTSLVSGEFRWKS